MILRISALAAIAFAAGSWAAPVLAADEVNVAPGLTLAGAPLALRGVDPVTLASLNAVAPGEIETEMIQPEYEALIPRIPLDKMGSPTDVAGAIHYLCSDDARYVTGTEIWVTGGQHMF